MELLVKAVAKNNRGILSNDTWFNADKSLYGEPFKALRPGSVITADVSDNKWIKSFTAEAGNTAATNPDKPAGGGIWRPHKPRRVDDRERPLRAGRVWDEHQVSELGVRDIGRLILARAHGQR